MFLWVRCAKNHSLPINSAFEVLVVFAWILAGFYLLFGADFRKSLAGWSVASLLFILLAIALTGSFDRAPRLRLAGPAIFEIHLALMFVAAAAFTFACVVAGMYVIQEYALKTSVIHPGRLPALSLQEAAHARLLEAGGCALALGLLAGVWTGADARFMAGNGILAGILALYVVLLSVRHFGRYPARMIAMGSMAIFFAALGVLVAMNRLAVLTVAVS